MIKLLSNVEKVRRCPVIENRAPEALDTSPLFLVNLDISN